jgi:hypothetical protein
LKSTAAAETGGSHCPPEFRNRRVDVGSSITDMMDPSAFVQRTPEMALGVVRRDELQIDSISRQLKELHISSLNRIVDYVGLAPVTKTPRVDLSRARDILNQYPDVMQSQIPTAYVTATFLLFK